MLSTIFFVIICIICIIAVVVGIGLFISWSKTKEKVFVANWISFLTTIFLCAVNLLPR